MGYRSSIKGEAMTRKFFMVLLLAFVSGCTPVSGPQPVAHSLYLGKRYLRFVMDNGPSYKDVRLRDGSVLHYWRSDTGHLMAIATGRDENYPDYCEIALRTDPHGIVRAITIIEDSPICIGVLK